MEHVIKREKPDGIVVSMGGQTALNCAVQLHEAGILEKYNVQVRRNETTREQVNHGGGGGREGGQRRAGKVCVVVCGHLDLDDVQSVESKRGVPPMVTRISDFPGCAVLCCTVW